MTLLGTKSSSVSPLPLSSSLLSLWCFAPLAPAYAAMSSTVRWIDVGVFWCVFVTAWAFRFEQLLQPAFGSSDTPADVRLMRNWLKVVWVDARWVSALVVKLASIFDCSIDQLEAKAMRKNKPLSVPEIAISKWALCGGPCPARIGLAYLGPKTLDGRFGWTSEPASLLIVEHVLC